MSEGRGRGRSGQRGRAQRAEAAESYPPVPRAEKILGRGYARGRSKAQPTSGGGDTDGKGRKSIPGDEPGTTGLEKKIEGLKLEKEEGEGGGGGSASGGRSGKTGRGGLRGTREGFSDIIRTRPEECITKKGTTGKVVDLRANYFKLETVPDWVIFQYRIDFNVDEDREGPKKIWLKQHSDKLGAYLFDGTVLFTPRRLTQDNKPLTLTSLRESDNFPVQIEIRLVQQLNYGNIVYLQVFSVLLRRSLSHLKLQLVNRNYFDASEAIKVSGHNMEVWPGYITSIKQNEADILMCTEITHKIMRLDTALDLLQECMRQGRDFRESYKNAIVGEVVLTDYNNKTYRIDDVDFSSNPTSTFKMKDGSSISYIDYYDRRYRIRIRDLTQPLLVSRASARSLRAGMPNYCLLIPELCRMTGLSSKMLDNFNLKKDLSDYTRINPEERVRRLLKFNHRLRTTPEIVREFKQWDIDLGGELVKVPGRELPAEVIVGGRGCTYSAGQEADWTREVRNRPMLMNGKIKDWVIVCPATLKADLMPFMDCLRKAARGMDFPLGQPRVFETTSDKPATLVEAVEDAYSRAKPDLVLFICPNNRSDRYNAIKKKCGVDRGVPSQVVLVRSMRKGLSVATKLLIQLNCKVGGAPWSIELPIKSVMVIGYDACHDTHSKGKSYGAMVASLNSALSSWFSSVSHHSSGEELSNSLSFDVCKALRKFVELNGSLPGRIFVYRDGVGEGQIPYVYEHEVSILKQRLTEIYGGPTWKLCYIIVSKRINTRLFKNNNNPKAGTVVDDVITLPERYDFYLISQNVNTGTVTPTSYNIISDNVGLKPDQIQRWTYKMTHLYYNWSGTVRVPAPCQYAHKLAFLVGQSLHIRPHPNLDTTLHFL